MHGAQAAAKNGAWLREICLYERCVVQMKQALYILRDDPRLNRRVYCTYPFLSHSESRKGALIPIRVDWNERRRPPDLQVGVDLAEEGVGNLNEFGRVSPFWFNGFPMRDRQLVLQALRSRLEPKYRIRTTKKPK